MQTAHPPYLSTDQLVADKKQQRAANKYEPATHLNDAIDPADFADAFIREFGL